MSFATLDVRVITLRRAFDLRALRRLLPGADVRVQPAVDLRAVPPMALARADVVAPSAFTTLQQGRKWHFELNSTGGVGLAQSVRLALEENDRPLLLLEDDFEVVDEARWVRECTTLLAHANMFDMASFGVAFQGSSIGLSPAYFMGDDAWQLAKGQFHYLHCVMYSPRGRGIVRRRLRDYPLDMQIDSLFGSLAEMDVLTIVLQVRRPSVTQRTHSSSIQTDACILCDIPALRQAHTLLFATALVTVCLLWCVHHHRSGMSRPPP